jgi:hypothetical protein
LRRRYRHGNFHSFNNLRRFDFSQRTRPRAKARMPASKRRKAASLAGGSCPLFRPPLSPFPKRLPFWGLSSLRELSFRAAIACRPNGNIFSEEWPSYG